MAGNDVTVFVRYCEPNATSPKIVGNYHSKAILKWYFRGVLEKVFKQQISEYRFCKCLDFLIFGVARFLVIWSVGEHDRHSEDFHCVADEQQQPPINQDDGAASRYANLGIERASGKLPDVDLAVKR